MKSICFVTTGNIRDIATAKRALGLAVPLADLGWTVYILLEDCAENRNRVNMECDSRIQIYYYQASNAFQERRSKNKIIRRIKPDYLYICAFVTRNIVGISQPCKKLVEHPELQSRIFGIKVLRKLSYYINEYYSIIYSDALINASKYLQNVYKKRARRLLRPNLPMLYLPYAYNGEVIKIKRSDELEDKFRKYLLRPTFLFIGSILRNYGVFTILEAVKISKENGSSNFTVLLLGKGEDYNEAAKFVTDNGLNDIIEMPGYIPEGDISKYFSVASAFLSPMNDTIQDWARCPSKLYMYLPYQKPIITCKIGEPYEVLKDNGFYYTPNCAAEMAEKMKEIIGIKDKAVCIDYSSHSWSARAEELNGWLDKQKMI
jgi:glycosyltransferase involved in cell wall biosynthesis